jgi:dolichyl-phosphate-mannose-protein mannosyltransferase
MRDFIHLNVAMMMSNNALTPDPEKEPDQLTSKPLQWPLASVGLRMCGWGDNEHKVYLLGNPVVWWSGTAALIIICMIWAVYTLRRHRGIFDWPLPEWEHFLYMSSVAVFGWLLHFVPFMIMARVTYLHHYFPALYFAIIACSFALEHVSLFLPRITRMPLFIGASLAVCGVFVYFAPLSLGFDGPASQYANRRWLDSWNIYG